jgi:hypothetical protein
VIKNPALFGKVSDHMGADVTEEYKYVRVSPFDAEMNKQHPLEGSNMKNFMILPNEIIKNRNVMTVETTASLRKRSMSIN